MKQVSIYDEIVPEYEASSAQTEPRADTEGKFGSQYGTNEIPVSGTAVANVTEIILAREKAHNIEMLLPMLTHLSQEKRWLAWIDPPQELIQQWKRNLSEKGAEDLLILRSSKSVSAAELMCRALAAGTCHAVITWTTQLCANTFKELEAASIRGLSHGIVLRHR